MRPGETADLAVLVVDDDFMVASIHAELVGEVDGFRVAGTAVNGQQALDMVAALTPDLLLLDVHLPDMNGIEVLRRLRQRGDDVDAIVVTAERDAEFVKAALRGGAAQYLIKPFDLDELRARILRYARGRLGSGKADQQAVDAAFSVSPEPRGAVPPPAALPPKGLSNESLDLVRGALAGGEELSATTCAEATGMARPTVRRYLEYLVERREARVRLRYGGGRPERLYQSVD
jgi:response regulator of citrate/malate metabolism